MGAAARISIERLDGAGALEAAIRAGDADLSLDDLPGGILADARRPVQRRSRSLRIDPREMAALGRERAPRALRSRSIGRALAQADGGDVVAARSLLLDPQAPGALPADPATARALLRRAGAEGTLRLPLWAEPGAQARVARAIGDQLAQIGVQVDVHVASAAERPSGARAWIEWLDPAYGDPAAIFMPLADALGRIEKGAQAARSQSACTEPRGSPAMRAGPRSGVSTSASVPVALAQFRCCVQTFLHRSRPCWWEEAPIRCSIVDLALFSTRS